MSQIKAIETVYKGYRFRSRLEARWAVFFGEAGIEYQYEPQGFTGIDGDPYLPDFYLPGEKVYAEVKGTNEQLKDDARKILGAIDFNCTPVAKGLIILGEIPNYENFSWGNIPMFPYLWHEKSCVRVERATFCKEIDSTSENIKLIKGNKNIISSLFQYDFGATVAGGEIPDFVSINESWTHDALYSFTVKFNTKLINAYKAARQARFEHGEKPVI